MEYSFEKMPHLGPTAGIGMFAGEPYRFDSEEEYRSWYNERLNEWLQNA